MALSRSIIVGVGSYLPQNIMTNQDLPQELETNDNWIVERTGIKQRHIADDDQLTSDLALSAAKNALSNAGIKAEEVDLIILATATPDNVFPATATKVQAALGIKHAAAFDVQAVCSGFIYALNVADNFIKLGQARCALVIGAETFSRIVDWTDRTTCVLFGDGAGAMVLKAENGSTSSRSRGILSSHIYSDGTYYDMLKVQGGPSQGQNNGFITMEGREVFRHAVTNLVNVVKESLLINKIDPSEIDWVVPHQANRRILDSVAQKLFISMDKFIITVDHHANTSAASIPLAFSEAFQDGRIKENNLVVLNAMGGGFTWGASLIRI